MLNLLCDRHQEAIALLKAVIKEAPNLPAAWHTMGWVHEARGNMQKALDFFMVSAHLSKVSLCLTIFIVTCHGIMTVSLWHQYDIHWL